MKNIGIDVKLPEKECTDVNCPFHGHLTVRGQIIVGTVVSNKMNKSIVVRKESKELIKSMRGMQRNSPNIMHICRIASM